MHIAASNPVCVQADDVPAETIRKEREIYMAQAMESGKPANIVEKMVDGRVRKFLEEITLLGQPFVKDPETTVGKLLAAAGAGWWHSGASRSARASKRSRRILRPRWRRRPLPRRRKADPSMAAPVGGRGAASALTGGFPRP